MTYFKPLSRCYPGDTEESTPPRKIKSV